MFHRRTSRRVVLRRKGSPAACERLEDRTLLSTLTFSGGTILLDATPQGGVKAVVNGTEHDYAPGQWDAVSATGFLTVKATVVPTTAIGPVSVGAGGTIGVQNIRAPLTLRVGPITIDDTGDASPHDVVLTSPAAATVAISGLAPALITAPASFRLNTGSGAGSIDVRSTAGGNITLITAPAEPIRVGDGRLGAVTGSIQVGPSRDRLILDDSANPDPAQLSIEESGTFYYGTFQHHTLSIPLTGNVLSLVTLFCGSGGNTINLFDMPFGQSAPAAVLGPGQTVPIIINTGAGSDTVVVRPIASFFLSIDGGAGSNTLSLLGSSVLGPGLNVSTVSPQALVSFAHFASIQLAAGDFAIDGDLGPVTLTVLPTAGQVTFVATQHLASLALADPQPAMIAMGSDAVLHTDSLSFQGTAKLDLGDNSLQLHYGSGASPTQAIRSWIVSGTIFSSLSDTSHTIGFADSRDGLAPGLATDTVLAKFALKGDANLDGTVDFADLLLLAQHYRQSGASWATSTTTARWISRTSFPWPLISPTARGHYQPRRSRSSPPHQRPLGAYVAEGAYAVH